MSNNLKDLLRAEAESTLTEGQMLAYLEGRLSPNELRAVEEALSNESADSDVLEGLCAIGPDDIYASKERLDAALANLLRKKARRQRRGIAQQRWTWLAIGIILLLAIAGYVVLRAVNHPLPQ